VRDNNLLSTGVQQDQVTDEETTSVSSTTSSDWSSITTDLQLLPDLNIENVLQYFIYQNEADGLQKQDWKSFGSGGYKLFKEGHVQKIYAKSLAGDVHVKATCLPEMKKDLAYSLEMRVKKSNARIYCAECGCPAGRGPQGSCKHIAALCYALEDLVKIRSIVIEGDDACTSLLQKWNQPRKKRLDSKKVEDIDFSNHPYGKVGPTRAHYKSYDPRPSNLQKTTKGDLEELTQQLKSYPTPCGFLHLLTQPSETTAITHMLPTTCIACQMLHTTVTVPDCHMHVLFLGVFAINE